MSLTGTKEDAKNLPITLWVLVLHITVQLRKKVPIYYTIMYVNCYVWNGLVQVSEDELEIVFPSPMFPKNCKLL